MMSIETLEFEPPRPWAAASRYGDLIFVAGETGVDPSTDTVVEGIDAQAEQALRNIESTLSRLDADLDGLLRLTVFLRSIDDLKAVGAVRRRVLRRAVPSATVEVSRFARPEMLIEIEAIAVRRSAMATEGA